MSASSCRESAIGLLRVTVDRGAVTGCRLISADGETAAESDAPSGAESELLGRAFRQIGNTSRGSGGSSRSPSPPRERRFSGKSGG